MNSINGRVQAILRQIERSNRQVNMFVSVKLILALVVVNMTEFRFGIRPVKGVGFEPVTGNIHEKLAGCSGAKQADHNVHFRKRGSTVSHGGYVHLGEWISKVRKKEH